MAQTSKMPRIQVSAVGGKRGYIPLKHDVYATHRVGKIVPYMCRFFDADGKVKVDLETLEYNAPMVGPTVGDVKFKQWHYFVGLDKILPNFAEMFAKNPDLNWNLEQYVKTKVPQISLRFLSMLALIGSYCTVYVTRTTNPWTNSLGSTQIGPTTTKKDTALLLQCGRNENGNQFQEYINFMNFFAEMGSGTAFYTNQDIIFDSPQARRTLFYKSLMPFVNVRTTGINLNVLDLKSGDNWLAGMNAPPDLGFIPLANPSVESLFDWTDFGKKVYADASYKRDTHGIDCTPVPLENPDVKITRTRSKVVYVDEEPIELEMELHFCFRLSDFGRAIRDIIQASGDQLNFITDRRVSFLPFIAIYQAYYHCQSLQMYENYKMTNAYRLIKSYDLTNAYSMDVKFANLWSDFNSENRALSIVSFEKFFSEELGCMWAITPQDFASVHQRDPIIAPLVYNSLDKFTTASNDQVVSNGEPISNTEPMRGEFGGLTNYTPFINKINHDVYVAELMKRLTLRMNVNTLEGRKTREACELNGWGEWLDLQKVDFIDYGEMDILMRPVVSQSDTATDDGKGANLGQYGGRGFGSGSQRGKTYVTKVPGYYVCLTTIYVDAGYCQSIDPYNFQVEVDDFYRRDYDSLGFEVNDKNLVHGQAVYVRDDEYGETDKPFGYAARDLKYKRMDNTLLGDFSTGLKSQIYDTYHLEKLLPMGFQPVVNVENADSDIHFTTFQLGARFDYKDFPKCGNIWRYLGRFPWLGQFERIFKIQPYEIQQIQGLYNLTDYGENLPQILNKLYTFFVQSPENYTILNTLYVDTWQDKVPVSRSFNTLSDIFEGGASKTIKKE